ncbi:MAG: nickel pincer cofactor biosynthesis protein LarC [Spirochaetaceae bacterium]|nr:nickel pincer cofactor biosynthesis protein LarC [Spirochaetaceae bacterium]GMO14980.1 MAG: nickel pincer cofactor biosynthesis protein LarC [Termitinemataceae bacterium]
MKTLHFECFAGISGDMTLGALVDLGVDPVFLKSELNKLGLEGWSLEFSREERCGIFGTQAIVRDLSANSGHGHRHWSEIKTIIQNAPINEGAKSRALSIFEALAKAESEVHGVKVEDVAFHEVGAIDSIIDIAGAAICIEQLCPDRITSSEVELGGGTVCCAHGELPVPAPATLKLCRGMPVRSGGFNFEMTTPTGAAILAASVDEFTAKMRWREIKSAYGIGGRKLEKPNVLRVSLREEADIEIKDGVKFEERFLLEANIDDMTGEGFGFLMESLFEAGALDVTFTPCVMKKSRPGTIVSVLCAENKLAKLRETLFRRSTTIGLREIPVRRYALEREISRNGELKTSWFGQQKRVKTEYEYRARIAREKNIPLDEAGTGNQNDS